MKDNQHEQLFTELTAEFDAPAVKELDDEVAATCSGGTFSTNGSNPDVILYSDVNFGGSALQINAKNGEGDPNLDNEFLGIGTDFNNKTSSILVIRGQWKIFKDDGYLGQNNTLTRGFYANPQAFGLANDSLTGILRIG